jgi:hypothetical protein
MTKEPVRIQLENGITAQVDWQSAHNPPFWSFGYVDDDCAESGEGGCYQPCMCGGQEPIETLHRGIQRYELPLPTDEKERASYLAYLESAVTQ